MLSIIGNRFHSDMTIVLDAKAGADKLSIEGFENTNSDRVKALMETSKKEVAPMLSGNGTVGGGSGEGKVVMDDEEDVMQ